MSGWPFARLNRPRQQGRAPLATVTNAVQGHPRLRVWRHPIVGEWAWRVSTPSGFPIDWGWGTGHAQALAVGLAALEQAALAHATVAGSRP